MKILISNITDSGILRNRLELISQFLSMGHSVVVVSPSSNSYIQLKEVGCDFIPIDIDGRGLNPIKDLKVIIAYHRILTITRPDIVLTFTIKPNLYCGINCRIMSIPQVMNITGFGAALAYPGTRQKVLVRLYRMVAKNVKLIFFQNQSNLDYFKKWRIACEEQYKLLPGSGVNLSRFVVSPYPSDEKGIHFLFISRIFKEKGIDNYMEAARIVKKKYPNTHFHILGNADLKYSNVINHAVDDGYVIWHGRVSNILDFHMISHCTVLPSYYPEGICNVLLEAAAAGRPVITTDHSGCREAVDDGHTGYLVRPNDTEDLVDKIELFLHLSNDERAIMGKNGRLKMEREFDRQIVVNAYMDVVKEIAQQKTV